MKLEGLIRIFMKSKDTITVDDSDKFETISIESKVREGRFP
ncbi:MAG: hypothetical protein ACW9XA_01720 [Candidatus Nitrosopumilus sp. bin_6a]